MKYKFYRPILYYSACALLVILKTIPRSISLWCARISAIIAYYGIKKERTKTVQNLITAYATTKSLAEVKRIARMAFVNAALTAVDFVLFSRISSASRNHMVRVTGEDILKHALSYGNGCLVITAHLGNWEWLGSYLVARGFAGEVIGKRIYYEGYNKLIVGLREKTGVRTYYSDQSPRGLLKILKEGKIVGMLPDQDIKSLDGMFVDFFGKPAYTPTAPAKIALAAHAPMVVAFMLREGKGYHLVVDSCIMPEMRVGETKAEAVERLTNAWHSVCERYIEQYPEQWMWMHNRWKTKQSEGNIQ